MFKTNRSEENDNLVTKTLLSKLITSSIILAMLEAERESYSENQINRGNIVHKIYQLYARLNDLHVLTAHTDTMLSAGTQNTIDLLFNLADEILCLTEKVMRKGVSRVQNQQRLTNMTPSQGS